MNCSRFLVRGLLACALPLSVSAATITYETLGCFGAACVPVAAPGTAPDASTPSGGPNLVFAPTGPMTVNLFPFSSTFFGSDLAVSVNLGGFYFNGVDSMNSTVYTYAGPFTLVINVSSPIPGCTKTATATITGNLQGTVGSSVKLTFSPDRNIVTGTPLLIEDFNDPSNGGQGHIFAEFANPTIPISANSSTNSFTLDGHFDEVLQAVPEPATFGLLGAGALGLVLIGYVRYPSRRRAA